MSRIDGGLSKLFRAHMPDFHWQRIEAESVGKGVPDMNYCHGGSEGWVEFKQTNGWTVDLRPEQVAWLMRRDRAGGRTLIAVRQLSKKMERDALWLIGGKFADRAKKFGLDETNVVIARVMHGGPAGWDWGAVRLILTNS